MCDTFQHSFKRGGGKPLRATIFWFFLVCLNVQAAGIRWTGELPENVDLDRTQAGILDSTGWTVAVASKGGFEVKLPFKFEEWSVLVPEYNQLVFSIGGTTKEGIRLLVSEFPNFDDDPEFTSKALSRKLLENTPNVRTRHFKYKGMDATQVRYRLATSDVVTRYIVAGNKLFSCSIESPRAFKRKAKKLESKFFNSFRLKRLKK